MNIYVARQPVYDLQRQLAGYELLYRTNDRENWAAGTDRRAMSSDVIIQVVLDVGLERITGGLTAFMNLTGDMLAAGHFAQLDPSLVVIELLEGAAPDERTLRACRRMADAGYRLALDDFSFDGGLAPLLPIAEIVKVDVLAHAGAELEALVARLRPFECTLLAEKVETREMYDRCVALGFELFQGYLFGMPEILVRRDVRGRGEDGNGDRPGDSSATSAPPRSSES